MCKKQILLFDWKSPSQWDLQEGFLDMQDCEVISFSMEPRNYDEDELFEDALSQQISQKGCNMCFSFNYFPIVSKVCQKMDVLYVSWIYDCPHTTLYSKTIYNSCNLVFTFDYMQMNEFRKKGVGHIYHMPLAVNVQRLENVISKCNAIEGKKKYSSDISFVGSIYEDNYYEQIGYIPEELKGYIDGICTAQLQIAGGELLEELLNEKVINELQKYVKLSIGEQYDISYKKLFQELFLKKYISSLERKSRLSALSNHFKTALYSGGQWRCTGLDFRGCVSYMEEMPLVFFHSGLNLNLSIRSIQSGIPLRCMDVMGAGGGLFSNYQPELAEYFEMDQEWISFRSKEEMIEKAEFYLQREELRQKIARKGFEKVREQFTYQTALRKILQVVNQYL